MQAHTAKRSVVEFQPDPSSHLPWFVGQEGKPKFRFSELFLTSTQITCIMRASRPTKRGGSRSSRNAGRDAVDAWVSPDVRH